MGARSKARKRALDILFESELQGRGVGASLEDREANPAQDVPDYTVTLVEGVVANAAQIDAEIALYAEGWTMERMPAVDRNILRLGVYELRHQQDVPRAVVLSEAVELAKDLSTDDSPAFINGVLSTIAKSELPPPVVEPGAPETDPAVSADGRAEQP
jgi:transcription antitermination protein NusB